MKSMSSRSIWIPLEFVLWTLLAFAIVFSVGFWAIFTLFALALCGAPGSTPLGCAGMGLLPTVCLVAMIVAALKTLRLWERPRGRYAALPIGVGLLSVATWPLWHGW